MTKYDIKSFIENRENLIKISKIIGTKFAEKFDIEFYDIYIDLTNNVTINYLDNCQEHFDFIRIEYSDLIDLDKCLDKLIKLKIEDELDLEKIVLLETIERLEKDKEHCKNWLNKINDEYSKTIIDLYRLEGMKILERNPEYYKYIEYTIKSEIHSLMGEYFIRTGEFENYNIEFNRVGVLIKFYKLDDEPSYYDEYDNNPFYKRNFTTEFVIPYGIFTEDKEEWLKHKC